MKFRSLMILLICILPYGLLQAALIDQPRFKVNGMVVVWGGENTDDMTVELLESRHQAQNYNAQPVITGVLQSVMSGQTVVDSLELGILEEPDAFTPFSKDTLESSFYVASNTAFTIRAELAKGENADQSLLQNIYRSLAVNKAGQYVGGDYGRSAQFPHSSDSPQGGVVNDGYLSELISQKIVFVGNQKTAKTQGSVIDQSVRFTNTYTLTNIQNIDVQSTQELVASVIYTIAIP